MRVVSRPARTAIVLAAASLSVGVLLPAAAAGQGEPVEGGTLIVAGDGVAEPASLNPAITASNGVLLYAAKIIEPLADVAADGSLRPLLATSWEGSDDGLTYTFHLRDGVTWSDGEPFTSADVAFSAMEVWKPFGNLGRQIFANLESVETPDDQTAILHFSAPMPPQLLEAAIPAVTSVVPEHILAGTDIAPAPDAEPNPYSLEPIGTGPFVLTEHQPGVLYRLGANESYWDVGKPYLDEIVFQFLPDPATKANAVETGEVHLVVFSGIPVLDLQRIDDLDGVSAVTSGYEDMTYEITLDFNHRNEILANPDVRKALRMAIDPQVIIDTVFGGYGAKVATGPVPTTDETFYTSDVTTYAYDPAAAQALLDEAGFPRGDDGIRFALRLRPAPFFAETRGTGDYVAQALEEIGVDVEIVSADAPGHIDAVYNTHDFDLAIDSPAYRNDPAISTTVLYQGGLDAGIPFTNQWGYDSAEMNQIIADAATETDPDARVELYHQFQQLAADDLPIAPLVEFTFTSVASDRVQNIGNTPRWAVSSWADTWLAPE
jgi:peptide/nickel transport system substrate-binding protein